MAVPHSSDRYRPRILDTTTLPWSTFKHTSGFPMYATNAAIMSLSATHLLSPESPEPLHLVRLTPLALSCSPMDLGVVLRTRYAENSHSVLVSGLGTTASARVLHHFSNAEDPRGLLHGGFLWLFYTTTLKIYYPGKVSKGAQPRTDMLPVNATSSSLAQATRMLI